ncbi:nucleotide disphospho-sugar-binding domain-containing protein [Streptacidiphilus albus]|uniref:nucleotide disphospho-sugar-binding domain-containing protein n=1 Tax=Streptacidiphilus albus TaxID=105425 RepID=UPI0005A9257B|nr:nucleotide disphospho-sugar-binding domain-containing protein [Streptacidiphilus albus]
MRVLMTTTPVPTHLTPMVPLAWALRAAGHEVLVVGQPDVEATVVAAGLSLARVGHPYHVDDLLLPYLPPGKRPLQSLGRPGPAGLADGAKTFLGHARYMVPRYLEVARQWRPDLVVGEQLEFASLVVGGALGIPVVRHRWGVDPLTALLRGAAGFFLDGLSRRHGLTSLPEPDLILDPCPPELQHASAAPGAPIRFVPFNGGGVRPEWALDRRTGRRVCVTLGGQTLKLNGMPLLRSVVDAFDGLADTEAVVTVDPAHRAELGPVPRNVRLVDPTPLSLFLNDCDAIVHHGGCGTAMTATATGLPQLVLPQIMDQFAVADGLVAAGAGLAVDSAEEQDDPSRVRAALEQLLDGAGFRLSATELGESVARMPAPAAVVGDLEALIASRSPELGGPEQTTADERHRRIFV